MANLKLKLKFNALEFEIEGEENVVREEFDKFKGFLATEFVNRVPEPKRDNIGKEGEQALLNHGQPSSFPVLLEVTKRDLPNNEPEWVLVYAFYASNFGQDFFTEQDIKDHYGSTGRTNKSRLANLSNSIKTLLNKGYIKLHNDTQYLFLDAGREAANLILNVDKKQSKSSKSYKVNGTKKKSGEGSASKTKKVDYHDFNYSAENVKSLREYFNSKKSATQTDEVLVVMRWAEVENAKKELGLQEIAYMLDICSKIPSALNQVLINAKGARYRWLRNVGDSTDVQLTTTGRLHVDEKLGGDKGNV